MGSWLDTLTSAPALVAGLVGISFAVYAGRNPQVKDQVTEQVKDVAQATQAGDSKARMAQAVSPLRRESCEGAHKLYSLHQSCRRLQRHWLFQRSVYPGHAPVTVHLITSRMIRSLHPISALSMAKIRPSQSMLLSRAKSLTCRQRETCTNRAQGTMSLLERTPAKAWVRHGPSGEQR